MEIQGVVPLEIWCLISQHLNIKSDRTSFWKTCRIWRRAITKARRPEIIYDICSDDIEWWGRLTHGMKGKKDYFILFRYGSNLRNVTLSNSLQIGKDFYLCDYPQHIDKIYLYKNRLQCYFATTKEFVDEIRIALNKFKLG